MSNEAATDKTDNLQLLSDAFAIRDNLRKCLAKSNGVVSNYFQEDGLGDALKNVLAIITKRLKNRSEKLCS
uniref:Uncharacterized protein n=1 Tax=Trichobilharzia regenti TaxID=157069 RepID=A0AA85JYP4_TRIRE|nr:unnamed protein product [Trichobilharzia regenti]CAH8833605.1 unnamed protein product [Trichobilharzia regenti]